jgi:hypothetical protein
MAQDFALSQADLTVLTQTAFEPETPHECTIVSFNRHGQAREIDRIYYHAPCTDGLCGASIVRHTNAYLTTHGIEPKQTNEAGVITEEDVRDKSILLIDQCLELEFFKRVLRAARHVDVIDHHASTVKTLQELVTWCRESAETEPLLRKLSYVLNTNATQSGVGMVWADRYPTRPLHWAFRYVQDRDLEQFRLPFAKEVSAALYKSKYQSMDVLDAEFPRVFFKEDALKRLVELAHEGRLELADQERRIEQYVKRQATVVSFKRSNYVALKTLHVRCDEFDIASSLCTRLANEGDTDVGIVTSSLPGMRIKVSLRTRRADLDLNALAGACFPGGGGHRGQAGAMLYKKRGDDLSHHLDFD